MYIRDNRTHNKGKKELTRDRQVIMRALTYLKGIKTYNFESDATTPRIKGRQETQVASITMLEEKDIDLMPTRKQLKGFGRKPLFFKSTVTDYHAMGYGEVAYIKEYHSNQLGSATTIYIVLRGNVMLEVSYLVGESSPNLWDFSLYYQQAIKDNKQQEFHESMKKDKYFYNKG